MGALATTAAVDPRQLMMGPPADLTFAVIGLSERSDRRIGEGRRAALDTLTRVRGPRGRRGPCSRLGGVVERAFGRFFAGRLGFRRRYADTRYGIWDLLAIRGGHGAYIAV